jgi:molybdopterin synthase sulfur carrier subunit
VIRVVLPAHLQALAGVPDEARLEVAPPVTLGAVLEALEARYPVLRGAIRDHVTRARRPFVRFFACERDCSLDPPDTLLPDAVAAGIEPLYIVGAIAGGAPIAGGALGDPDRVLSAEVEQKTRATSPQLRASSRLPRNGATPGNSHSSHILSTIDWMKAISSSVRCAKRPCFMRYSRTGRRPFFRQS